MQGRGSLVETIAKAAKEGTLAHGYLVVSRDRIALKEAAGPLLRAIDGEHRLQLADGLLVELGEDESSIGIKVINDEVRPHLQSFPGVARYRTALIMNAELLTTEAQNALLKTAEEPPEHSVLVLMATDAERLLPTLRSRLQRLALPRLPDEDVALWLRDNAGLDAEAAAKVAARSGGSLELASELATPTPAMRYAESLLLATGASVAAIAKDAAGDEVPLRDLLRALSVQLAYTARTTRTQELWHRTQRLTRQAQSSPLNLRLQVAALFNDLPS